MLDTCSGKDSRQYDEQASFQWEMVMGPPLNRLLLMTRDRREYLERALEAGQALADELRQLERIESYLYQHQL